MGLAGGRLEMYTKIVYTIFVKNITFSADADLIESARAAAKAQKKTLNDAFREWLIQFAGHVGTGQEYDALMSRLRHVRARRTYTRDEMNER